MRLDNNEFFRIDKQRLLQFCGWSRMRRREEQAQKLISAARLPVTSLANFPEARSWKALNCHLLGERGFVGSVSAPVVRSVRK